MRLVEAKALAQQHFAGEGVVTLERLGGQCIVRTEKRVLGVGSSWLEAMRNSALNVTRCTTVNELAAKAVAKARGPRALRVLVRPFAWLTAAWVLLRTWWRQR